ncbi:hypothetical protein GCM10009532_15040 [Microbacterium aurantiacum]
MTAPVRAPAAGSLLDTEAGGLIVLERTRRSARREEFVTTGGSALRIPVSLSSAVVDRFSVEAAVHALQVANVA